MPEVPKAALCTQHGGCKSRKNTFGYVLSIPLITQQVLGASAMKMVTCRTTFCHQSGTQGQSADFFPPFKEQAFSDYCSCELTLNVKALALAAFLLHTTAIAYRFKRCRYVQTRPRVVLFLSERPGSRPLLPSQKKPRFSAQNLVPNC